MLVLLENGSGEVTSILNRFDRADPGPAALETAEMLGLGERSLGSGRRNLQGVVEQQLVQLPGDRLAKLQIHALRVIDVQASLRENRVVLYTE